jgi:hypothetical protein
MGLAAACSTAALRSAMSSAVRLSSASSSRLPGPPPQHAKSGNAWQQAAGPPRHAPGHRAECTSVCVPAVAAQPHSSVSLHASDSSPGIYPAFVRRCLLGNAWRMHCRSLKPGVQGQWSLMNN